MRSTPYPDGTELSQASRIVWRGEEDLDGYEIRLRAVPEFHIRGTVVDEAGKPVEGATVKLAETDGAAPVLLSLGQTDRQTTTQAGGAFELSAVRPGEWLLAAEWQRANQSLGGAATGRVSRGDWEGVKIRLDAPFSVRGIVETPAGAKARSVVLVSALDPSEALPGASGTADVEGRFELRDLRPGRYRITTVGPQDRFYLDSIRFGGQEVLGQSVYLMDASLPVRVVYKTNGGRVLGAVEHCAAVLLFPKDASLQTASFVRTARCDPGGRFEMGTLRPGDYFAAALAAPELESLEQALDEILFDPQIVSDSRIARSAESVRVEAGQSTAVTLQLMPWPEE
ncbi:MAG: carboxypeptidase-like regulatory domain-containing protein [Candidatus Sulfopaludibacter sp.]|nr:carboxypeptidase-like regulatory domain-containing protein [Candidatus Sulfopaludibacter sp.]